MRQTGGGGRCGGVLLVLLALEKLAQGQRLGDADDDEHHKLDHGPPDNLGVDTLSGIAEFLFALALVVLLLADAANDVVQLADLDLDCRQVFLLGDLWKMVRRRG